MDSLVFDFSLIDKALIVWEDSDRFELYSVYAAKEGEEPKLAAQTTDDCIMFSGLEPDTSYIFSVQASSGDEVYDFGSVCCKTKGIETLSVDDLYAVAVQDARFVKLRAEV